jgi:ABC-type transport system involved in multi-copper enzyme maturation permease subunit
MINGIIQKQIKWRRKKMSKTKNSSNIEIKPVIDTSDRDEEIDWSNLRKISWKRMIVLSKKTFLDLFGPKGFIITVIIMIFLPVMVGSIGNVLSPNPVDYGSLSVYSAAMRISFTVIQYFYFWTFGLIFSSIIGVKAGKQIVTEVADGTMLMLISKPIGRLQIFLGKYIAIIAYGSLVSIVSLTLTMWINILILTGNISHFIQVIPFMGVTFLYTLFVMSIFTTISMALSAIVNKPRSVTLASVGIVAITFILFLILNFMNLGPMLAKYYITYLNLGYHFGNVYVLFVDIFNALPNSAIWQASFNIFTGIFTEASTDSTQDISLGGLEHNGYVQPVVSLLILVGFSLLMLLMGLRSLKRKEISN